MHVLMLLLLLVQDEELQFEKEPVFCAAIDFEVRIPQNWKVAMDKTGMSVRGDAGGFVITREPFLGQEETFAEEWRVILVNAGLKTTVEKARAGRYRAFHAQWESPRAPGLRVDVYRVYVPDLQMLYNVSFSTRKVEDPKELIEGVLKSFKVTAKPTKLELQKKQTKVGSAGTFRLPKGCVAGPANRMQRGTVYLRYLTGYEKPKVVVSIRVDSIRTDIRLQDGLTSDPEVLNRVYIKQFGLQDAKWIKEPKSKAAGYGGLKGSALTGRMRGKEGDVYEVYLWSGKGKRQAPTILIVAHERETRLFKSYFKTILKSFKASK
ncbi:MAG: hypothetical protein ACYTEG_10475 [Planctomycetota bacterium]|jgi:hypothetical protein